MVVQKRYGELHADDYSSIIDPRSFDRLTAALEEARAGGARLMPLLPGPCLLYTSPSPRDRTRSRMPSSA